PLVGSSSLISSRISVDLPDPVDPTRNTNSPRSTEKVAWSSPTSPAYSLETSRNSITRRRVGRAGADSRGGAIGASAPRRRVPGRIFDEVAISAGQRSERLVDDGTLRGPCNGICRN